MKQSVRTASGPRVRVGAALALGGLVACSAAAAQESPGKPAHEGMSKDEIAREMANPNTVLGQLEFNNDYTVFKGSLPDADDQSAFTTTFQPILPYPLAKNVNFYARPAIPVIWNQDVPTATGYESKGADLGNISYDLAIGKSFENGWVVAPGVAGSIPTATDDALGKDQWTLGPEIIVGHVSKKLVAGMLLSHTWDVAGDDDEPQTNLTAGQYFYFFSLGDGWQITGTPTFAYDHEASSGDRWTLPIGIGLAKTTIIGKTPWKFAAEYWHYVEQADPFGPDWNIRIKITPVVPLPWKGKK